MTSRMKANPRRNELCWCGSGRKSKKCHLLQESPMPQDPQERLRRFNKAFGKLHCLYPETLKKTCGSSPVRAHSLGKASALSKIAKNGKVYSFTGELSDILSRGEMVIPRLVGYNEASVFEGMCAEHDSVAFKLIDQNEVAIDEQSAFLFGYRAVCKALHTKQGQVQLDRTSAGETDVIGELYRELEETGKYRIMERSVEECYRSLLRFKRAHDEVLLGKQWDRVNYYALTFDCTPELATCGVSEVCMNFAGRIYNYKDEAYPDSIAFNLIPQDMGGLALFTWIDKSPYCLEFIQSLNRLTEKQLPDVIVRYALLHENTFASPVWWDTLPDQTRANLVSHRKQSTFLRERTSFVPDSSSRVSWRVLDKNTNLVRRAIPASTS